MAFEALKASRRPHSGAKFELVAGPLTDIHDDLIGRLGVTPGERWLATGTGAVAIGAARRGASVTGSDIAGS